MTGELGKNRPKPEQRGVVFVVHVLIIGVHGAVHVSGHGLGPAQDMPQLCVRLPDIEDVGQGVFHETGFGAGGTVGPDFLLVPQE